MRTVEAEFARNIARSCNMLEQVLPKPALSPNKAIDCMSLYLEINGYLPAEF